MDKLKMHTQDLTAENIEKLAALFPSCVTEAKDKKTGTLKPVIDFDQLRQELSDSIVEGPRERYHLDWPGKLEALLAANAPIAKTLRPCCEESVDFDTTRNLFIEGDNLDALKLLQETYLGKVKVIYIDPPYNTGKDFLYDDDYSEGEEVFLQRTNQKDDIGCRLIANTESNGRFHSDWLSMVYPRLRLARTLLSDTGLIFLSIDEQEAGNLRKVCDEVFGEQNFISEMVVLTGANQSGDGVTIQTNTEYCLVYSKSIADVSVNRIDPVDESLRNLNDAPTPLETRKDMGYSIYYNPETQDFLPVFDYDKDKIHLNTIDDVYTDDVTLIRKGYTPIRPGFRNRKLHRWRWGMDTFLERKNEIVIEKKTDGRYAVSFRQSGFNAPKNILNFGGGTSEVKELFEGHKVFDFPKSYKYIKHLLAIGSEKDSIILDFFAGSSTSAHAVLAINAEDSGSRQFIMVQLPEPTPAESDANKLGYKTISDLSKERIRRAGAKIKAENATSAPNLDVGFRVLKIDTSNMADVYYAPDAVKQTDLVAHTDNIKADRTPEDLLFQVLVDWGVDLALPITQEEIAGKTVFFVDGNALVACFDSKVSETLVKELAERKPLRAVFRDSSFDSDSTKINVEQIFKLLSPETEVKSL
ncbi:MAG: site-specific DNA-methyltransferase [Verrucomicrobiales bacterium]|nr:MAG: site-specific DNA-methyltransferase [Verrucomicrobiales bacterium]